MDLAAEFNQAAFLPAWQCDSICSSVDERGNCTSTYVDIQQCALEWHNLHLWLVRGYPWHFSTWSL